MVTKEQVIQALAKVNDPELHRSIVELGMVKDVAVCGDDVSFTVVLTTPACPLREQIERDTKQAVMQLGIPIDKIKVNVTAEVRSDTRLGGKVLPDTVKTVFAVGSGKGGVGKSTVAVNIAVSLSQMGAKVGLMDADIYGPNIPRMLGTNELPAVTPQKKLVPPKAHGIKVISVGFLIEEEKPMIMRGPMLAGLVRQFLADVEWGELDYLVVDLPPGTGDVQLTLCQLVPLSGAVIVTTPQDVALSDVKKSISMFKQVNVPILGVVENMSVFVCPECGHESHIFRSGGGEKLSALFSTPLLGSVVLDPAVAEGGDSGKPVTLTLPDSPAAKSFKMIAQSVAARISIEMESARGEEEVVIQRLV